MMAPLDSTRSRMQNLKVYKKLKHDVQSEKERSTNQVSKRLENLTVHDSLTILEAFLPLVIGKRFTSMHSLKNEN